MKRQYYPNSAADRWPHARLSLAAIPLLGWVVVGLIWLGSGQDVVAQPTITQQPTSVSVSVGARVVFVVTATTTSPPLTYQWQLEGTNLSGATSATLTLQNVTLEQEGTYRAVVSDAVGSRTSNPATLDVDPTFFKVTTGDIVTNFAASIFVNCWGDYDGDGYEDLVVGGCANFGNVQLYHNERDGTFRRILTGPIAELSADHCANWASWADHDNDGDLDLWMSHWASANTTIFLNDGAGNFTKVYTTAAWTANGIDLKGGAMALADYDSDGLLDAAFGNWPPEMTMRSSLLHNLGNGRFEVITNSAFAACNNVETLKWVDYDGDGDPDLHGTFGTPRLFQNQGDGTFVVVTDSPLLVGNRSIGSSWFDYDNDGDLDVIITMLNVGDWARFLRNLGGGRFESIAMPPITTSLDWGHPVCGDYDNDGDLDMFVAAIRGLRSRLFENLGNGTFQDVLTGSPANEGGATMQPWTASWSDYDNDGFLDLFVANQSAANLLYRNNLANAGNTNRWLKIKPDGRISNRSAIGALVRVRATLGGQSIWQTRLISASVNQHQLIAHFGLADATNVEMLRIEWPSGLVTELTNLPVNQFLTIPEVGVGLSPRSVVTAPGSNVTLRAIVAGMASPVLQWKLDGVDLPGATNDTLVLNNIQVADAGTYTVEASDGIQTYLSNPCLVTVFDKPVITRQPQPLTVIEGSNATFTVSAISATPIRYQWRFNSNALPGRTSSTLTLTNVQPEQQGDYDVLVSDDHGSVFSDPAPLRVLAKPRITLCATNYTVVQGGNLTLSVEARSDGALPITYVWRRNTSVKARQTNDSHQSFFTLTNVQLAEDRTNNVYYLVNLMNIATTGTGTQSDRIYLTVVADSDGDQMPDDWEIAHGLNPGDSSDAASDGDSDGFTNCQECQCGTNPTNSNSCLKIDQISVSSPARVEFVARTNRTYTVQYADSLPYTYTSTPLEITWFTNNVPTSVTYPHDGAWRNAPDGVIWHKLTDVVAGPTDRTVVLTDPAGASQRFYRLITPQHP